jgi:hypothetical protein
LSDISLFLCRLVRATKADGDFGTSRQNSARAAQRWVAALPRPAVEAITAECADVLAALNYPVGDFLPPAPVPNITQLQRPQL